MKKINKICVCIFILIFVCIIMQSYVKATESNLYTVEFYVENSDNRDYNVYVLLPKEYIEYAINNSNLEIQYTGAETLRNNTIPGINVNKNNIQDEVYSDGNKEYVQILLEQKEENKYVFNVLEGYTNINIAFRIRENNENSDYDYIVELDEDYNIKDNICQIFYDYEQKIAKNEGGSKMNIGPIQILVAVIIILIVLGIIYKITRKGRNEQSK